MEKKLFDSTVLTLLFILIIQAVSVMGATNNQTLLYLHLFNDYHREVRPICGEDATIETKIGISVRQIIDLDEPKQILTLNVWMRMGWYDCQLRWDPANFGGITNLIVPFENLWVPDITLYDNAGDGISGYKDYRAIIDNTGSVSYNFPTVLRSLCKVDVTYFPFDTQICQLPFGSWAYHGFQLDLKNRSLTGDMSNFLKNGEWELVGIPQIRHVTMYTCCPEPYPDVTFYITMRRKSLFYVLNLLFPCILITSVALLGFLLPPDSGEKVSLEITVLLSLAVFLLVVSETLPPTSENFPYIGLYFCLSMMLVTLSTVLTVLVLNYHFKGQHGRPVPRWMKSLFLESLGRILCVTNNEKSVHPQDTEVNIDYIMQKYPASENDFGKPMANGINNYHQELSPEARTEASSPQQEEENQFTPLVNVLKEQLYVVKKIKKIYDLKNKEDQMMSEWMQLAVVLDRLFLVVFAVISATCTMGILIKAAS